LGLNRARSGIALAPDFPKLRGMKTGLVFFVLLSLGGALVPSRAVESLGLSAATATGPQPGKPYLNPALKLELATIPAGSFVMGSSYLDSSRRDDEVLHRVILTRSFWLGRTPVTQAQYEAVMGTNPSHFKGSDFPVETVSWDDAMTFCRKLTEQERAAGRLSAGFAFTLPTEAQREYACRAGTDGRYAGPLNEIAWYSGNSDERVHAVGEKQPNAWGLYDMQGNVWEWCADWYGNYEAEAANDPAGPARGRSRVYRGGAWFHSADLCRSSARFKTEPDYRGSLLGFRIALVGVQ